MAKALIEAENVSAKKSIIRKSPAIVVVDIPIESEIISTESHITEKEKLLVSIKDLLSESGIIFNDSDFYNFSKTQLTCLDRSISVLQNLGVQVIIEFIDRHDLNNLLQDSSQFMKAVKVKDLPIIKKLLGLTSIPKKVEPESININDYGNIFSGKKS